MAKKNQKVKKAKPKKPTYSASRLKHYFRCPRAFDLSRHYEADIGSGTQGAMREGELFEGYIFGFKPDKDEQTLIGRKAKATIDGIKYHANHVKPAFEGVEGAPYQFNAYEGPDYIVRGEFDYIGYLNEDYLHEIALELDFEPIGKCIADLKYTGDISRVWDYNNAKEDYLQAVFYPYIHWKNTGELLPFVYIIVESKFKVPIVRLIKMNLTVLDFTMFIEPMIEKVHKDFLFRPKPDKETCLGGYGTSACWFLDFCEFGRKVVGGRREFNFLELYTDGRM